jgi:hypothetical protein
MKAGTLESMKFKRLMRRLNESLRSTAGLLEVLWQRACRDCPRGDLGRFENEEIAIMADYDGDPDDLVAALTETGWLDASEEHRLVIHDWHEHAPNYVKGVVSRRGGFVTQGTLPKVDDPELPTKSATQGMPPPSLAKPSLAKPSLVKPSQASPSQVANWREVEEVLISHGVAKASEALEAAMLAGCSPIHVRNLIEVWRARKPQWGPGALYDRVKLLRPGQDILQLWPNVSEESVRASSDDERQRKVLEQLAKRKEREAELKRNREEQAANPVSAVEQFQKRIVVPKAPTIVLEAQS